MQNQIKVAILYEILYFLGRLGSQSNQEMNGEMEQGKEVRTLLPSLRGN